MTQHAAEVPIKTTLVDITKCIGCRACQVACKQWNDREGEETELDFNLGFQNPATLSANTLTLITFHEIPDEKAQGGLHYLFTMRRCLHCLEPACASACPTTALDRRSDGPVIYDANQCIGCRYCIWACPWGVPTAEWDSLAPKIQKCTHCADRSDQPVPLARNGQALSLVESNLYREKIVTPACVKACPADCLRFGTRDEILQEAHNRISAHPDKYVDHIYGEKEAGGTSCVVPVLRALRQARIPRCWHRGVSGALENGFACGSPRSVGCRRLAGWRICLLETQDVRRDGQGPSGSVTPRRTRTITPSSSPSRTGC